MPKYERHVFVCCNERENGHPRGCCSDKGSKELLEALKAEVRKHGLNPRVRINKAGCLDQCEHGANMVVYPEQAWYGGVTPADAAELVASHLVGGQPVVRLLMADSCVNAVRCPHRGGPAVSLGGRP
jgi:(2Fe-2S) ferredoxin